MIDMPQLKECPFCNGKVDLKMKSEEVNGRIYFGESKPRKEIKSFYYIRCGNCDYAFEEVDSGHPLLDIDKLINRWNIRYDQSIMD